MALHRRRYRREGPVERRPDMRRVAALAQFVGVQRAENVSLTQNRLAKPDDPALVRSVASSAIAVMAEAVLDPTDEVPSIQRGKACERAVELRHDLRGKLQVLSAMNRQQASREVAGAAGAELAV